MIHGQGAKREREGEGRSHLHHYFHPSHSNVIHSPSVAVGDMETDLPPDLLCGRARRAHSDVAIFPVVSGLLGQQGYEVILEVTCVFARRERVCKITDDADGRTKEIFRAMRVSRDGIQQTEYWLDERLDVLCCGVGGILAFFFCSSQVLNQELGEKELLP